MRIAMLGLGFMGGVHLRALRDVAGATLAAGVLNDERQLSCGLLAPPGQFGAPRRTLRFFRGQAIPRPGGRARRRRHRCGGSLPAYVPARSGGGASAARPQARPRGKAHGDGGRGRALHDRRGGACRQDPHERAGFAIFPRVCGLALISIEQLIGYRRRTERQLSRQAQTTIPNAYGQWHAFGYRHEVDGTEYVALVLGDVTDGADVLTRLHSECLTGDVFGSLRCDCGAQLEAAMAAISAEGRGVVLYLRGHEGRGVGLLSKLQAYQLQDAGADTVDANTELGLPVDAREYSAGAQMLADLGVRSVRLLTNNPAKVSGLTDGGVDITARVPLPAAVTQYNLRYLVTKRDKLGHQIQDLNEAERSLVTHPVPLNARPVRSPVPSEAESA